MIKYSEAYIIQNGFNDEFEKCAQAGLLAKFFSVLGGALQKVPWQYAKNLGTYVTEGVQAAGRGESVLNYMSKFRTPEVLKMPSGGVTLENITGAPAKTGFIQRGLGDMANAIKEVRSIPNQGFFGGVMETGKRLFNIEKDSLRTSRYRILNPEEKPSFLFKQPHEIITKNNKTYLKGRGWAPDRLATKITEGPHAGSYLVKKRIPNQVLGMGMTPVGMAGTTMAFGGSPSDAAKDLVGWRFAKPYEEIKMVTDMV